MTSFRDQNARLLGSFHEGLSRLFRIKPLFNHGNDGHAHQRGAGRAVPWA